MFPASMAVAMFDVTTFSLLVTTSLLVLIIRRDLQTTGIPCIALLLKHMRIIMLLVFMFAGMTLKT